jgi:hypothetical protein
VQGAILLGNLVNFSSTTEILRVATSAVGTEAHYLGDGVIEIDGEIGSETLRSLRDLVGTHEIDVLSLNSPGGIIEPATRIGAIVEEQRIATYVATRCESACTLVAFSGAQLYVSRRAQFGFHQGSVVAREKSQIGRFLSAQATMELEEGLRALGIPDEVLEYVRNTPPGEMRYLDGERLLQLGLADYAVD